MAHEPEVVRVRVAASPADATESVTRESFLLAVDDAEVRNDSIVLRTVPTPHPGPALRWSFSNPSDTDAALVHTRPALDGKRWIFSRLALR